MPKKVDDTSANRKYFDLEDTYQLCSHRRRFVISGTHCLILNKGQIFNFNRVMVNASVEV